MGGVRASKALLDTLGGWTSVPRVLGDAFDPLLLPPDHEVILDQVDGAATVQDIADGSALPIDDVLRILCALVRDGVVEIAPPRSHPATGGRARSA